jgi:hypothetical protein
MGDCLISNCATTSGIARQRRSAFGQVPKGFKLASSCANSACVLKSHLILEKWQNFRPDSALKKIAATVQDLGLDAYIDLPKFPNTADEINALRSYFAQFTDRRTVIRPMLPRGVRIFATGTYGTASLGTNSTRSEKYYAPKRLIAVARKHQAGMLPGAFMLGMCAFSGEKRDESTIFCSEKGCVYPAHLRGLCKYHIETLHVSFDDTVDKRDLIVPKEYPHLPLELTVSWAGMDRKSFLRTKVVFEGKPLGTPNYEKENDEWWRENVIEKGLLNDDDGVIGSKLDEVVLKEEPADDSIENIKRFFGYAGALEDTED